MLWYRALGPSQDPEPSRLNAIGCLQQGGNMRIACFGAPGVGSKSELPNAVGNRSVGDFAWQLFVACASGLGRSSE